MRDADHPENPYASPRYANTVPAPPRSLFWHSFQVGVEERHEVKVLMFLSGRESYYVDGQEVLKTRSWWGRRRFVVGKRERHDVEILVSPLARVRLRVDGQKQCDDLMPALRRSFTLTIVAGIVALVALALHSVAAQLPGANCPIPW